MLHAMLPVLFLPCGCNLADSQLDWACLLRRSIAVLLPDAWHERCQQSAESHGRAITCCLQVPAMQAAIASYVTRLQYSYSEMGVQDHKLLGPDALDVALWAMTYQTDLGVPPPSYAPVGPELKEPPLLFVFDDEDGSDMLGDYDSECGSRNCGASAAHSCAAGRAGS